MNKLRAMEILVATAETGTLSGAAAKLGLSNAAVTAQVQALERHLRTTLLRRTTRHLQFTPEGQAFLVHARAILAAVAEAEAEIGTDAVHGVLRVQVPIAVGHLVLAPALAAFAKAYPELGIVTILDNEVGRLGRTATDIAIRFDEVETDDLVARPIYRSVHVLCAAPSFLAQQNALRHPDDIDATHCLGWVEDATASPRPWRLQRGQKTVEIRPSGSLFFNSSDALLRAAAEGAGFVYVLDLLAHAQLQTGRLQAVLPDWETEEQIFYVTYPKTRFTAPKIRAFADFAAHAFPQHFRPPTRSVIRVRRK